MKKIFIIVVLFALPLVAYLFFASGVHNFAKLPILTPQINSLENFKDLDGNAVTFQDKINILGFFGEHPMEMEGNTFNLTEKIYKPYYKFKDFQFIMVLPKGSEAEAQQLRQKIEELTDPIKWHFVFGDPQDIKELFVSLKSNLTLNQDLASPNVFIVDKDASLRGRNKDDEKGLLFGYNTRSVAELNNKMDDDVKVILAEYRLELKKYNKNTHGK